MSQKFVFSWVFILILILACGSGDRAANKSEDTSGQEKAGPAAVGQDVMVGDIRWKILEAKDLGQELKSDNDFIDPKTTGGKFIMVRLEVENRKNEAATYGGINLVDDKDRKFERYDEQFGFIPEKESCVLENLNPNISRVCSEIFEVPADAKRIRAVIGDLEIFGGEERLVELGF